MPEDEEARPPQPRMRRRIGWSVILSIVALLIVAALCIPTLDVNKRQRANQAMALAKLQRIHNLQRDFAATHPSVGYSCELAQLKTTHPEKGDYDPEAFLAPGKQWGYRFELIGCHTQADGVVRRYQIAAVPVKRFDSGFRYDTFCAEESGGVRYHPTGSAENCIASGTELE